MYDGFRFYYVGFMDLFQMLGWAIAQAQKQRKPPRCEL